MPAFPPRLLLAAGLAVLALGACRSDDVQGSPPDATALPEGASPPAAPDESPTDNTPDAAQRSRHASGHAVNASTSRPR